MDRVEQKTRVPASGRKKWRERATSRGSLQLELILLLVRRDLDEERRPGDGAVDVGDRPILQLGHVLCVPGLGLRVHAAELGRRPRLAGHDAVPAYAGPALVRERPG